MWKKVGIGLGIVSLIVVPYIWGILVFPEWIPSVQDRGQWGDSFGIVTSLFTVLAFIGVIWTIHQSTKQHCEQLASQQQELRLQRKELELQREELTHTREEIKGQKEQLAAQNKTLRHQNFESSFFQLLGLYNSIIDTMEIPGGRNDERRNSFRTMHQSLNMLVTYPSNMGWAEPSQRLLNQLETEVEEASCKEDTKQIIVEEIDERGEGFLKDYQVYVGHYFRHLYNMFDFVDKEDNFLTSQEKKYYTNLIRAQLSDYELAVLFYYALNKREKDFKRLIEKYALLKNLDFNLLIHEEAHYDRLCNIFKSLYKDGAYVESDHLPKEE